ncbi:dihydrofolate reductase [Solibacillus sp. FSL W7-1464]|uniref:dihydrofolate reductase n=1 Tax=Solibacillus sp. FSL W7-1464 TaxID=2921706 RepID=UPI0030F9B8AE
MISLIVAHDENRVIGYQNDLPWYLPGDLKYFKEMTMGKPMIMGRKTYDSIGRPLPGRRNIVITRNTDFAADGIEVVGSLEEALSLVEGEEEVMIIGGAQIFEQSMEIADRLYITLINHSFKGDTYFPSYDDWKQISCLEPIESDAGYTFQYCIYEK